MQRFNLGAVLIFLAVMLAFMGVGYLAGAASASTGNGRADALSPARQLLSSLNPGSGSELVDKAFETLEDQYFMNLDDATRQKMLYSALQGLMNPLRREPYEDDFTNFYDPEFYENLMAETAGRYAGVGIMMGVTPDGMYPEVNQVFPETPAMEAGIQKGDIISAVEDEDTFGMILPEVATKIKGPPGTKVKLRIFHADSGEITDHEIERREVEFSSVPDVSMLDDQVGYIQISNFAEDTGKDFRAGMEKLIGEGMKSLVIDLRDNPGGLLDAAVAVADAFVREGPIVKVEFRGDSSRNEVLEADPNSTKYELPILVLVNSSSASASEVLTSALRDYGLARVMGEQTFGKGVVQAVQPMEFMTREVTGPDGVAREQLTPKSAIAVVIGKYYTPEHKEIHMEGIEPDIWFDYQNLLREDAKLKGYEDRLKEQRDAMSALRTEATRYVRNNDLTKLEAQEIAAALARGEQVPNRAKIEPPEEEHSPLASTLGTGEAQRMPPTTVGDGGSETHPEVVTE